MIPDTIEEADARGYDAALMRRLLRYLRPYRWPAAAAVLLLLFNAGLTVVGPILTQRVLDVAVPARDVAMLLRLTLFYLGALVLGFATDYCHALVTTWIGQRVMSDLRMQLFSRLQRLSVPFFDRNPVGRLMTRVTSDVETLNELFSSGVVTVFGDIFTLVAIVAAMLFADWRLALVAVSVVPVMGLAAVTFRRRVRTAFRDIRTRLARLNAMLQEHLSGVRIVQLFGRERSAARAFAAVNRDHLEAHLRSITVYAVFFPVVEFLTTVALALLLWYGGLRVFEGSLTVGVLAAFIQLTRRFFEPLQDLSEKYNLLQAAMASSERIFHLLDTRPTVPEPDRPRLLDSPVRGAVSFEGVWFRYANPSEREPAAPAGRAGRAEERGPADGEGWVLRDISFTARPGETLALVGHTGAGKTTIISLLLRFYDPERGRITIDGVDIRQLSTDSLRGLIGFVPQDLFLFGGDLQHNLSLDRAPEAAVRRAVERIGVGRLISRLPDGYHHVLGERGKSLSVGERQLLSFARALAQDPSILVLDEATSSVDAEAEAEIQQALSELMRGRTSLVVAHRLSTVQHANQILVLHHGQIRERGTHRELLRAGGLYQRLCELQLGGVGIATPLAP